MLLPLTSKTTTRSVPLSVKLIVRLGGALKAELSPIRSDYWTCLARYKVRGTFFVLGWVADRFPHLIQQIVTAGHEVGSHSYWHRLAYQLTPTEFREDLRRSVGVIEDVTGVKVSCYRAPSFSITRQSLWALDVLVEEGLRIDSSVFPTHHDRYGIPGAQPTIHTVKTLAGPILEFPPSVACWGQLAIPVGGGGYFRLYPYSLSRFLLQRINGTERRPFMFYVHPWEVDPNQPKLKAGSRMGQFRHHVNLASTVSKLERLLTDFRFGSIADVFASHAACQKVAA